MLTWTANETNNERQFIITKMWESEKAIRFFARLLLARFFLAAISLRSLPLWAQRTLCAPSGSDVSGSIAASLRENWIYFTTLYDHVCRMCVANERKARNYVHLIISNFFSSNMFRFPIALQFGWTWWLRAPVVSRRVFSETVNVRVSPRRVETLAGGIPFGELCARHSPFGDKKEYWKMHTRTSNEFVLLHDGRNILASPITNYFWLFFPYFFLFASISSSSSSSALCSNWMSWFFTKIKTNSTQSIHNSFDVFRFAFFGVHDV